MTDESLTGRAMPVRAPEASAGYHPKREEERMVKWGRKRQILGMARERDFRWKLVVDQLTEGGLLAGQAVLPPCAYILT